MSSAALLHLAALISTVARILAPPAASVGLDRFADRIQILDRNGKQVPLDWRGHPAHREILRLWAAGLYRRLVVLGPPQDGKTTVFAVILLYTLVEMCRPSMYAVTDQRLGANLWLQKMMPMIKLSGLAWVLPASGPGSTTGAPDSVLFQTGAQFNRLGAGATNGAGQAGITSCLSIIDEASKIRGPQRTFLLDRNRSYGDERQTALTGTLEKDMGDYLLEQYERSTAGRLQYPCPHCGTWQTLEWSRHEMDMTSELSAKATVVLHCSTCPATFNDETRLAMLPHGKLVMVGQRVELVDGVPTVVGSPPPVETAGVRWTALDSPLQTLGGLAVEYHQALDLKTRSDDHDALRQFHHAPLVEIYADQEEVLALREIDLAQRSAVADHELNVLPADTDFLTVAIDVQLRSLYWLVLAWNRTSARHWIVAYGRVVVCGDGETPHEQQHHDALDKIAAKVADGWAFDNGQVIFPVRGGVDTADGVTRPAVLSWLARRPGWHALRGQSERSTPDVATGTAVFRLPGVLSIYLQNTTKPAWHQVSINVDQMKAEVYRALSRAPGTPGSLGLPAGEAADGPLIMQLTAERQEPTANGPRWVRRRRNNHYLDVTAYCVALAKWHASIPITTKRRPDISNYMGES